MVTISDFKTAMGVTAITGLQVLPMWLYAHYTGVLSTLHIPGVLQYMGIGVLAASRALCSAVEVGCLSYTGRNALLVPAILWRAVFSY